MTIFTVAELARRRRDRGRLLSAPEVVAVVTDEVMEAAWDGSAMEEVVAAGLNAVVRSQAQPGVAGLVRHIQIDALFPTGTALVVIDDPLGIPGPDDPGAILVGAAVRQLNAHRSTIDLDVQNVGDEPIRISSHYPFWQVNTALHFDREAATGYRLDIPSGGNVAFPPGDIVAVTLVALGGTRTAPPLRIERGSLPTPPTHDVGVSSAS